MYHKSMNTSEASSTTTTQSVSNDGYKLTIEGVLWFLSKEVFGLIPLWVWILIMSLILIRFLLGPLISFILVIHKYLCCGCLPCLTTMYRTVSVSETRAELLEKMSKIKLGVWRNDDGSEITYNPSPEEKELMDKINYNLKHVLE